MPVADETALAAGAAQASPVVRGLLTEHVARELEAEIRSGEFGVGARLPSERDLARRFGASRNVVREALRRLEAQRFVSVEAGRGTFVSPLPGPEHAAVDDDFGIAIERPSVRQLIEARLPIELETAGLAARRASRNDLDELTVANRRIDDAVGPVDKAHADLAFHLKVAAASGNPVLQVMLSSIGGMMFEMMLRSNSDPSIFVHGVPHHPEVLEAILARDEHGARDAMRRHLEMGLVTYGADLDERLDVMARRHLDALLRRVAEH